VVATEIKNFQVKMGSAVTNSSAEPVFIYFSIRDFTAKRVVASPQNGKSLI
jgi:hypothetical protein